MLNAHTVNLNMIMLNRFCQEIISDSVSDSDNKFALFQKKDDNKEN